MKVLIADDDPTSRLLLKAMVAKLGHEPVVAEDGLEAWNQLARGDIDVLLSDWMMPGLDGLQLCRRVREELRHSYVYIVLTTGLDYPERVLEGMSAGADDYLTKPVDSFAVQTRLVAAQRVTALHAKLSDTQAELERANVDLLERSLTDELTGLGNRRRMEEDLARMHARALRVGRPYAIALFDIDEFKHYNDHYGHLAGDQALRDISAQIDLVVRAGECVYRYGGEEFLLLMQDCDPTNSSFAAAERIRRSVLDVGMPHEARQSDPPVITVSGGIATWIPGSEATAKEVVQQADEALYLAKECGRNCVHVAPTSALAPVEWAVPVTF